MGRTYTVPRSAKGEGRILYIFSLKSLATTAIGAIVGIPFYFLFSFMGMGIVGVISIVVCAVLGYAIEVLSIPDNPLFGNLRKAGGEKLRDILVRTATFSRRKKIYIYRPKKNVNKIQNVKLSENKLEEQNKVESEMIEKNEVI